MNTFGERRGLSDPLHIAWDEVKTTLSRFASILRSRDGCEDIIVTVCMRNGSRVDAYSLPADVSDVRNVQEAERDRVVEKLSEEVPNSMEMVRTGETFNQGTATSTRIETPISPMFNDKNTIANISEYLNGLSTQQLRTFLTNVRRRLKLKTFDWPEAAKKRFVAELNAPVPLAPGRAHSGKHALLYVLRLSIETDDAWKDSVLNTLESIRQGMSHNLPVEEITSEEYRADEDRAASSDRLASNECDDEELEDNGSVKSLASNECDDEELEDNGSDVPKNPEHILDVACNLPSDSMKVIIPAQDWVPLPVLLSYVRHPRINNGTEWFIQPIPGDGNCMFSSILVAAKLRGCLPSSLDSVHKMRKMLRKELIELSRAGRISSKYRRDWLASCLHDVDDLELQRYCNEHLEKAVRSYGERDMEEFLAPLRIFVSNWADMVGGEHWGGLLRVELCIFASMLGVVIEVMQPAGAQDANISTTAINACDTRSGNRLTALERTDILYPHGATLPTVDDGFLGTVGNVRSSSGWVGPYPLLRVVLNNRHYSACTSRCSYPISPQENGNTMSPGNPYFAQSDTLIEPFSSLNNVEREYYQRALEMIQNWREACNVSPESGKHADCIVMQSKCTTLTVSMLAHLGDPGSVSISHQRYLISDEIVTCYMYLLQGRSDDVRRHHNMNGSSAPPRSVYMDSWFFKSLWRGLSGPSWKRKRIDLREYNTIIIPALVQGHWALAVCYVEEGIIGVYDPFKVPRHDIFRVILQWVQCKLPGGDKKSWKYQEITETRGCKQVGSIDCGIYICKAAESLGLGFPVRISQSDICYVRKRMMVEFTRQETTNINWTRRAFR